MGKAEPHAHTRSHSAEAASLKLFLHDFVNFNFFFLTAENAEESAEIAEVLMIACFNVGLFLIVNCQLSIVNS